jgi:dihydroorotase
MSHSILIATLLLASVSQAQEGYDLVLKGGHVIDPKNGLSGVRDVGIRDGKVAAVADSIDVTKAKQVVDARGLYVVPGIVDIHAHVYTGTGERHSYAGDYSVYPDGFTFRSGVTTVVDAGGSGWRTFADFQDRIIDRSKTRVLAMINIVGNGMRGGKYEQDLSDMDAEATAKMALAHKGVIVGIKCAHYAGPEWTPVERSVEAGTQASIPVMIDFGTNYPDRRPLETLLTEKLRPGDIYTHMYSGLRNELLDNGQPNPALLAAKRRGVILDVGHGGGSFVWRVAVPLMKAGIVPDSISTDLHVGSMNGGMKDILNVMSKFLAMGMPLDDVIAKSTWAPAREIQRPDLGHLTPGGVADIVVLRLEKGNFGFLDIYNARLNGTSKLTAELTLKDGKVMWDLNGIAGKDWTKLPPGYGQPKP